MEQLELAGVISDAATLLSQLSCAIDRCLSTTPASPEAWSLASIRDALEVLEDQLRCLQSLPCQLKAEITATLAEIEESRGIFIRRLKQHRGSETGVIRQALDFAGETVHEQNESFPADGIVDEDYSAVPHKIVVQETAMDHDLSAVKGMHNSFAEDIGGFMCRDGAENMYSIMTGYGKHDANMMYNSFGEEILECMLRDGTGQMYRVMAADTKHANVMYNVFRDEVPDCMLKEDNEQVHERDQKGDRRQGGIFGRLKSGIGTFLKGRFVKLSAGILLTAAGAAVAVALSDSVRGRHGANGVRRRSINNRFALMHERQHRHGQGHDLLHV